MFKVSYQFIVKNIKKSLVVIVSIILSVALLVGIVSIIRSSNISKSEYYGNINGNYQYTYTLKKEQVKKLSQILEMEGLDIEAYGITTYINAVDEPRVITIQGCSQGYFDMNQMKLLKGKMPSTSNEIVLEQWMISNLGLSGNLEEILKCDDKEYTVVGIVSDSFEKYYNNIVAYTSIDTNFDSEYKLYVNFDNEKDIKKDSAQLMSELGCKAKDISANWDVLEPLGVKAPTEDGFKPIRWLYEIATIENIVIVLLAFFSAFIIYSILNVLLFQKISQYGILQALGAGSKQIFEVIFEEIFILFIAGFPIGCLVGIEGAKLLFRRFSHLFLSTEITMLDFFVSLKAIQFGFVFLVILLVLIAWKFTTVITKQSSMEALKGTNRFVKNRRSYADKRERLLNCISHRYMTLRIRIFLGILFSLSIGGVLFCSADYIIQESKKENEMTMKADDGLNSDYSVYIETSSFAQGMSENIVDDLGKINGVSEIHPVKNFLGETYLTKEKLTNKHFFDDSNNDQRLKDYFNGICTEENGGFFVKGNIYGYNEDMIHKLKEYLIEGSLSVQQMEAEDGVIICLPQDGGTLKFDTVNIKPGDIIEITVPKSLDPQGDVLKFQGQENLYDTKKVKVIATVKRVLAHNDYFVGPYGLDIIMTNSMMTDYFGIDKYNMINISKEKDNTGSKIANHIREMVKPIERCNFVDYTSLVEKENHNLQQRELFFLGVSVIIVLISIFHIFNSINYLILSKKQDFGMLRAMGVSNKMLRNMLLKEGALYGIGASCFMIVETAVITLGLYIYLQKNSLVYEPQYILRWDYLAIWIVINISLCVISVFFSSRTILKEEIIDCMRNLE